MIAFKNVQKSYGTVQLLRGINAHTPESTVTCIIGASGAGKSTMRRCIAGLETCHGGAVLSACPWAARNPFGGVLDSGFGPGRGDRGAAVLFDGDACRACALTGPLARVTGRGPGRKA